MARPNGTNAKKIGRRERIRTSGPYVPNVVLYQAELLSEPVRKGEPLPSGGALITMPPCPRNRPCSRMQQLGRPAILGFARPICGRARLALYGSAPGVTPLPLGRRQAVRLWILIPAFEGSIPSAPASSFPKTFMGDPRPVACAPGVRRAKRSTGPLSNARRTPSAPASSFPKTFMGIPGPSHALRAFAAQSGPPDRFQMRAEPLPPQPVHSRRPFTGSDPSHRPFWLSACEQTPPAGQGPLCPRGGSRFPASRR
jgi:hypothetical protein